MTTPPLDLPALKEIATTATPGEWSIENITSTDPRDRIGPFLVYSETQNADGDLPAIVGSPDDGIPYSDARHIAAFDPPTTLALLDRVERAERACQTLGRVIDRQCEDALTATDSQDLLWGNDGDGDWGAIWERVLGLGEKAREATARAEAAERDLAAVTVSRDGWQTRAEAAEKAVARVREIAHRLHSEYHQADEVTESIDHADDIAHELDTALDTHTPETETTP